MSAVWRIELMGGLRAVGPDRILDRFRTRQTAALLAFLALYRDRTHPRDALADRFWPDAPPQVALHRLSVALSSLRPLLALPGHPPGTLLLATRRSLQLNPRARHHRRRRPRGAGGLRCGGARRPGRSHVHRRVGGGAGAVVGGSDRGGAGGHGVD